MKSIDDILYRTCFGNGFWRFKNLFLQIDVARSRKRARFASEPLQVSSTSYITWLGSLDLLLMAIHSICYLCKMVEHSSTEGRNFSFDFLSASGLCNVLQRTKA